jgi:hypothetical protein
MLLADLPVYAFAPNWGGLLSLILTLVLPILVALVSTRLTSSGTKAVLLLALATIQTFVEALISAANDYAHFAWVPVIMNAVLNFGVAVIAHFGLWKPTGTADAALDTGVQPPKIAPTPPTMY